MRIDTWLKIWCPKCQVPNWINDGDTSDLTGFDVENIECFNCGEKFTINEDELEECPSDFYEKGQEKPD